MPDDGSVARANVKLIAGMLGTGNRAEAHRVRVSAATTQVLRRAPAA